jgi:hypothetical protein
LVWATDTNALETGAGQGCEAHVAQVPGSNGIPHPDAGFSAKRLSAAKGPHRDAGDAARRVAMLRRGIEKT